MFLVLGNATIDESMATDAWPTPGQTIVVGPPRRDLGGKGANQALMLSRTGAPGPVRRRDRPATPKAIGSPSGFAEEGLAADLRAGRCGHRPFADLRQSRRRERHRLDRRAAAALTPEFTRAQAAALAPGDLLMMQGNLSLAATEAAFAAARAAGRADGVQSLADPAGLRELLPLVDLLVVNEGEAERLGGAGEPEAIGEALRSAGAGAVALTLGARGSTVRRRRRA